MVDNHEFYAELIKTKNKIIKQLANLVEKSYNEGVGDFCINAIYDDLIIKPCFDNSLSKKELEKVLERL